MAHQYLSHLQWEESGGHLRFCVQECVGVGGEEFVTSLASLTENLLHQLDDSLTATGNLPPLTCSRWEEFALSISGPFGHQLTALRHLLVTTKLFSVCFSIETEAVTSHQQCGDRAVTMETETVQKPVSR